MSWDGDRLQRPGGQETTGKWEVTRNDLIIAWKAEGGEFEATGIYEALGEG